RSGTDRNGRYRCSQQGNERKATAMTSTETLTGERADFLQTLRVHRGFLLKTVHGLSEEQARQRPTVSELTLGCLIKHAANTEKSWAGFIVAGASAFGQ